MAQQLTIGDAGLLAKISIITYFYCFMNIIKELYIVYINRHHFNYRDLFISIRVGVQFMFVIFGMVQLRRYICLVENCSLPKVRKVFFFCIIFSIILAFGEYFIKKKFYFQKFSNSNISFIDSSCILADENHEGRCKITNCNFMNNQNTREKYSFRIFGNSCNFNLGKGSNFIVDKSNGTVSNDKDSILIKTLILQVVILSITALPIVFIGKTKTQKDAVSINKRLEKKR